MANDGWVKLVKNITTFLPKDRKYTKVEAAVSYLVNQDNGNSISIRGYSRIWGWGHGTTERFIDLVQKRYTNEESNSNNIHTLDDQSGTKTVQKRDTNYKTKTKTRLIYIYSCAFDQFWSVYPKKKAKGDAWKAWKVLNPSETLQREMISAVEKQKTTPDWKKDGGQFIPLPATWIRGRRWEDEIPEETPYRSSPGLKSIAEIVKERGF